MADFKLGRLKFKWRGDWTTSTGYVIDDIVKYGGNSYVCIANHTSPNNENLFYTTPATYTTNWQLHGESFYFKGAYANTTWYKLNDLVSYGGKQYRCTTAHTSSSEVLNQSNFEQYSDGITFRGDYASSTQYRLNDLVKYGGRTYRVTTEHTSASGGDVNIDLAKLSIEKSREWPINLGIGKPYNPDQSIQNMLTKFLNKELTNDELITKLKISKYNKSDYRSKLVNNIVKAVK